MNDKVYDTTSENTSANKNEKNEIKSEKYFSKSLPNSIFLEDCTALEKLVK